MQEARMYVKVTFDRVREYFQIFPEDKIKVTMFLNGDFNPSSVVFTSDASY